MTARPTPDSDPSRRPPGWRVEGMPDGDRTERSGGSNLPGGRWSWLLLLAALFVFNLLIFNALTRPEPRIPVPYTTFIAQVRAGNVASVTATGDTIQGEFKTPVPSPDDPTVTATSFRTERPTFATDDLLTLLQSQGVVVNAEPADQPPPLWQQIVFGLGPSILLIWLLFVMFRRMGNAVGGLTGLGRSRAKRYEPEGGRRTTFEDVAGIEDAKQELEEVVDFLQHPTKYTRLGGTIPRGVLLAGPPGTGKTLLARAVAGEANVPFFSMSASEFVEMVVGVGAARVRDLFDEAKKVAPSIVFIDEIDAIGRARGGPMSFGGHDEREQTLNQILTEMDGFTGSEGVIVIAATNRPDVLDPALLRPGRFDRQVFVSPPDRVGRRKILEVHTRDMPLAADVDLDTIAASTPGMVGADLRNLVNEAALTAARRDHDKVHQTDFLDALEKIVLGTERQIMMSREERERTAYHESGHALLGMLQPGADPVRKISIIPRGRALGVTLQSPEADRYAYDVEYLRGRIIGALGGRAAEEIVYGTVTTGAENDLVQVTNIARQMVGRWGMSEEIGPVSVLSDEDRDPFPWSNQVSPRTQELIDAEVRRIVDECYASAVATLKEHRHRLDALAEALLEHETLEEEEAYRIAGIPRHPEDEG